MLSGVFGLILSWLIFRVIEGDGGYGALLAQYIGNSDLLGLSGAILLCPKLYSIMYSHMKDKQMKARPVHILDNNSVLKKVQTVVRCVLFIVDLSWSPAKMMLPSSGHPPCLSVYASVHRCVVIVQSLPFAQEDSFP